MLADLLQQHLGGTWRCRALNASGFCETWRAESSSIGALFVKSAPPSRAEVLEAEADGLRALAATATIRVPAVIDVRCDEGLAWLALEWLDFEVNDNGFGARFGARLAALHAAPAPGAGRFGWHRDNRLGGTVQSNGWSARRGREGWIEFVVQRRLRAFSEGLSSPLVAAVERVIEAMPRFFDEDRHVPRPCLVHGDLWSGNWACQRGGVPVIFDPAVSVADAEYELAMMELFGSPPAGFWTAYRERMPVAEGYAQRRPLYQLVHLLNHARLFGGGYERQALAVCASLGVR